MASYRRRTVQPPGSALGSGGGAFGSIPRLMRSSIAVALLRASSSVISSVPPQVWRTVLTRTLRPRWPCQRSRCALQDFPGLVHRNEAARHLRIPHRGRLALIGQPLILASVKFSDIPHLPANRKRTGGGTGGNGQLRGILLPNA